MEDNGKQQQVLISVIVPVFNAEYYLTSCVDSILKQNFSGYEILLIDDGSTDNSGLICDRYASEYSNVRVIHKKNTGVSASRNLGIREAFGRWVCFVDSDDLVETSYLSFFDIEPKIKETLIYHNIKEYNEDTETHKNLTDYPKILSITSIKEAIENYSIILNGYPFAKLFNRDLIIEKSLWFNEKLSMHEDHLFVLNYLLYVTRISFTGNTNYQYIIRKNVGSLSRKRQNPIAMLCASNEFLSINDAIFKKFSIKDKRIKQTAYTEFGLAQLSVAARNATADDFNQVFNQIKDRSGYYLSYYRPKNKINWIFYFLVFLKLPNKYLFKIKELLDRYK